MNCYYLELDEVDHELTIRNLKGLDKESDKRRELRRILRDERHSPELVPVITALVAQDELDICKKKVSELSELIKQHETNVPRHNEIHSRVLHVKFRLNRIVLDETQDCTESTTSVEQLLGICKGIEAKLKIKGGKSRNKDHERHNSTPKQSEKINEGASTSKNISSVEEELQLAKNVIRKLMSTLSMKKQKDKSNLNESGYPSDSDDSDLSSNESQRTYFSKHMERSHRKVRDDTPFRTRQNIPREEDRMVHKGMRVSSWNLSFSGDPKGRSLSDFLNRIEHLANAEGVSNSELFRSGYHLFTGVALDWYIAFSKNYNNWEALVTGLKAQFLPHDYEYWLLKDIEKRVQLPNESFGIYLANMELMFRNLPYVMSEGQKVDILRRNILPAYQDKLALSEIYSIIRLSELCKKIETSMFQVKRRGGVSFAEQEMSSTPAVKSNLRSTSPTPNRTLFTPPSSPRRTFEREVSLRCYNCLEEGHHFNNCPKPRRLFCYKCGHQGVASPDCGRCRRASGNV